MSEPRRFIALGPLARVCAVLGACLLLAGCAAQRLHQEGLDLLDAGQVEAGLARLEQAVAADPTNGKFRAALYSGRTDAINRYMSQAGSALARGKPEEAEGLLRRVLVLEPGNDRAQRALDELARDRRHQPLLE
jgi:general secretion pathway protein D